MARTIGAPALALAAVLATGGFAAADDGPAQAGFGTTMTLGGQGTAAQAAAADDTELTHYRRFYGGKFGGFNGGFRPYYGGFGYGFRTFYPAYYGGFGYRGFYPGYFGGFGGPFYSSFYTRSFYYPPFGYGGFGGFGYSKGFFFGISGTQQDASAPVVSLALKVANNPMVVREPAPAAPPAGTFRYDGGPANPVPLPAPEAAPAVPPAALPISLPKTAPAKPYTYKAYGEK